MMSAPAAHPGNPPGAGEARVVAGERAVALEPSGEIAFADGVPVVDRDDRHPFVHRVERRRRYEHDVAEGQRFPGAMAIEPGAVGADDEGKLAAPPEHRA